MGRAARETADMSKRKPRPEITSGLGSCCEGSSFKSDRNGALRRVRAYIDDHIGERISLDQLARHAAASRFHFARQFRLSTGESPMGYLRRARIERSKSILQSRRATIAEVAARLGF